MGYCTIGNCPLLEAIFWTGNSSEKFNGPFRTEEEFNKAMLEIYIYNNGSVHTIKLKRLKAKFLVALKSQIFSPQFTS